MVSEEEMRKIMRGVRCIGPYNAGVEEAAQLLAEAMQKGVGWEGTGQIVHGLNSTSVNVPGAGRLTLEDNWGDARPGVHGQRVCVIVRLEEGMGDGEGD